MNAYDIETLSKKDKQFRQELLSINEKLIKLMLSKDVSNSMHFYNNIEEKGKEFRENIFWYLSAMQDIRKFPNIYPKIEQELRDYRLFVELQKEMVELWFKNNNYQKIR